MRYIIVNEKLPKYNVEENIKYNAFAFYLEKLEIKFSQQLRLKCSCHLWNASSRRG